jgi:hypothetical protein
MDVRITSSIAIERLRVFTQPRPRAVIDPLCVGGKLCAIKKKRKYRMQKAIFGYICAPSATGAVQAQDNSPATVPVTVENFIRAETDLYFSAVALKEGGFGKFEHHREVSDVN